MSSQEQVVISEIPECIACQAVATVMAYRVRRGVIQPYPTCWDCAHVEDRILWRLAKKKKEAAPC